MFKNMCSHNSGIYLIVNLTKDKIYVGKSKNMHNRISSHISDAKKMKNSMHQDIMNEDLFMSFDLLIIDNDSRRGVIEHELIYNLNYYNQNSKRFKKSTGLAFKKYSMYNTLLTNKIDFEKDDYEPIKVNSYHIQMVQLLDIVHKNIKRNSLLMYEILKEESDLIGKNLNYAVEFRIRLDEELIGSEETDELFRNVAET